MDAMGKGFVAIAQMGASWMPSITAGARTRDNRRHSIASTPALSWGEPSRRKG